MPFADQVSPRLSRLLGGAQLYLKRDDLDGLGGGDKLEFLLGDALAERADTVVTVDARLTAAACTRLGLACGLVMTRSVARPDGDYVSNGNVRLMTGGLPGLLAYRSAF